MSEWQKVRFAGDMVKCPWGCADVWCEEHEQHYWECACPGPHMEETHDYKEIDGELYARLKPDAFE